MTFDKNQKDFPSQVHEAIWQAGIKIIPLEISLPQEVRNELPVYMAESCVQLRKFFLHILSDLYDNPEIYEPFPHRYLGIQCKFIMPFAEFGQIGEAGEGYLSINQLIFDKLFLKQIKNKAYHADRKITISVEQRKEILERIGLKINYEGNNAVLTNALYPDMFYAMREMALAVIKEKSGGDNSFTYCDFRKLCKNYKYDKFESALIFLNDEQRNFAVKLDEIAKKLKFTRSIKSGHCPGYDINYKYNQATVMSLNCLNNNILLRINLFYDENNTAPTDNFFGAIEKDSDELKTFVYGRLNRCVKCYNKCPLYAQTGRAIKIYDKTNRICWQELGLNIPTKGKNNSIKQTDIHFLEKTLINVKNLMDEAYDYGV